MSLRCLLIDDEPLAHNVIINYSSEVPFLEIVCQCYRATEALDFLAKNDVDLLFLDIQMPKLNGLDFLRTLTHPPLVIITSAYQGYALESFDLHVCDYLLKPFRFERFLKAANRAFEIYSLRKQLSTPELTQSSEVATSTSQIAIKADKKTVLINLRDILYFESLGNYVKVFINDYFLLTPRTLASFEEQLPSYFFKRIHKSVIVNKKQLHYIEGNTLFLKTGQQLPIGKNYRQTVKQLFGLSD